MHECMRVVMSVLLCMRCSWVYLWTRVFVVEAEVHSAWRLELEGRLGSFAADAAALRHELAALHGDRAALQRRLQATEAEAAVLRSRLRGAEVRARGLHEDHVSLSLRLQHHEMRLGEEGEAAEAGTAAKVAPPPLSMQRAFPGLGGTMLYGAPVSGDETGVH